MPQRKEQDKERWHYCTSTRPPAAGARVSKGVACGVLRANSDKLISPLHPPNWVISSPYLTAAQRRSITRVKVSLFATDFESTLVEGYRGVQQLSTITADS